ncbi:unnamed protein product [Rhizophagus irregularis]|nr:unnamed protein product [Rhizophagus irregularis]
MAVDRFGSYIGILPILRYPVIEKNILPPDMLYVIFCIGMKTDIYKIEVYRLYGALHRDLSQFAVDSFSKYESELRGELQDEIFINKSNEKKIRSLVKELEQCYRTISIQDNTIIARERDRET